MFYNKLGGNYGKEDLQTEFKELCLQIALDLYITDSEAEEILEKKIWNPKLQFAIDDTIQIYLTSVIPKYVTSFSGSSINGELFIGIDDFGEITGIPYYGEMSKSTISNYISLTIRDKIETGTNENYKDILNNISVDIIKLEIEQLLLIDEYSDLYTKYKEAIFRRNDIMSEYQKKRMSWLLELSKYSRKLTETINSSEGRKEMIPYVLERSQEFDNEEHLNKIIAILSSNQYVHIPDYDELVIRKKKKEDILYWLVKFKDYHTARVSAQRPSKPSFSKVFSPFQILSKLSLMRKLFSSIEGIYYYLIKINIKGEKITNINLKGSERLLTRLIDDKGRPYTNR